MMKKTPFAETIWTQVRSLSVASNSQDGGSLLPGMVHSNFIFFSIFITLYLGLVHSKKWT